VWYFSGEMFATSYFRGHMLLALYVEDIDGIRILCKATILCPIPYDIVLHYHTVFYFFVVFCGFVPYTYTICRGDVILGYERRGDVGDAVE
jgi:hypothetical protein